MNKENNNISLGAATKCCLKCRKVKPVDKFYKKQSQCMDCQLDQWVDWQLSDYRLENDMQNIITYEINNKYDFIG